MPGQHRKHPQSFSLHEPSHSAWKGIKQKDLTNLSERIRKGFRWEHLPRDYQVEAVKAQLLRKDVLIHAGTGSGKTACAAGPYALPAAQNLVTIMVSPLVALQEEQISPHTMPVFLCLIINYSIHVQTFRDEFKLRSVAVNHIHGGCSPQLMTQICDGKYQIVVISPEMLLSKRFIEGVLRRTSFTQRLLSVVIDEAHVISHWGHGFRKEYGRLGILRALLPKGTPFVAMSATLGARVRHDVLSKLQYDERDYININLGNERPNVSLVVRAIHNPMNTYRDLDFLIPAAAKVPSDIKKAFVYADSIAIGSEIEDHLYSIAPPGFRDAGIIRPYNATYTAGHRAELMVLFKAGVVRLLVCTDAAGMGCNIPDIDIVVQWKLPSSISAFVQRAGRAGRGHGRTGLAVLLVEKSVYEADLSKLTENGAKASKSRGVRQSNTYPTASKEYSVQHGALRGAFGGQTDANIACAEVVLDAKSPDEGLYTLVQTGKCRRAVLTTVYANDVPHPTVACCDLCSPELLNLTRPGEPVPPIRATTSLKSGVPDIDVIEALDKWRRTIWAQDFTDSLLSPSSILEDDTLFKLASVGPSISTLIQLEQVVGEDWIWFGKYGDTLLAEILGLAIPPLVPKPRKVRVSKRVIGDGIDNEGERGRKRACEAPSTMTAGPSRAIAAPAPTGVTCRPAVVPSSVPATPARPSQNPYAVLQMQTPHHQYTSSPAPYTPFHQPYQQYTTPYTYYSPQSYYYQPMFQHLPHPTAPPTPLSRNTDLESSRQ